jgi:hypothetical protein
MKSDRHHQQRRGAPHGQVVSDQARLRRGIAQWKIVHSSAKLAESQGEDYSTAFQRIRFELFGIEPKNDPKGRHD